MESLIKEMISAFWVEALRNWGAYALVLTPLGFGNWSKSRRLAAKDREIATLQNLRVKEVEKMVRVTEAATLVIASRGQSDQRIAELLAEIVQALPTKRKPPAPKVARIP